MSKRWFPSSQLASTTSSKYTKNEAESSSRSLSITFWKVLGAPQSPKGILTNSKRPGRKQRLSFRHVTLRFQSGENPIGNRSLRICFCLPPYLEYPGLGVDGRPLFSCLHSGDGNRLQTSRICHPLSLPVRWVRQKRSLMVGLLSVSAFHLLVLQLPL